MKIINLTKDSFVEKVADYQSYPDSWNFKGNNLAWSIFMHPGVSIAKHYRLY